ncbi:hypothetical protein [Sandaracinus amylolyticus]|uniref:hypothetical protein n=1 Tax=Sandaracinus amylolyticus TaxID=927083 RepID=UPI001F401053|nr:hypothetical protein [Sandaracinus amylolyticus]UJR79178.1 Hypothetical protein I5071_12110 [Sandaracinus amylolyticus]
MARSLTATDVVQLPTLSAEDAYTLVSQLLHQASRAPAPASLEELVIELASRHSTLQSQLVARRAKPGVDTKIAVEADRAVDTAWSALRDWLSGWVKLGAAVPRATEIAELDSFLFADGLSFLTYRFEAEWAESETRLTALRARRNEELVRALGGAPFLDVLFAAHARYGEALGVAGDTAPAPSDAKIGESRDAMLDALREYVVAVLGTVRRSRPATSERADQLLRPLAEWEARPRTPAAPGEKPTPTT